MSDYESLRARHTELFHHLRPEYLARLGWTREMLQQHRTRELRKVLAIAKAHAPAYRQRLANVDPVTATEADLARIQPLTKDELMNDFENFLTDRRLSRELVESHLTNLTDDAYLLDEFHVAESSGSSGRRGVFVYGWDAWPVFFLTLVRFRLRYQRAHPYIGLTRRRAAVAAGKAPYTTYVLPRTFLGPGTATSLAATLPLPEIVNRLNALQPAVIDGYASMLFLLAREALAGRLRVTPRIVAPNSEPLRPEMRQAMEAAWHCPILNCYGTSEGVSATSCGQGTGMHLNEDVAIFELVDNNGHPVPPGVRAAKIYITNLYNHVEPLIRYELPDEVTVVDEPCPCGCAMRRVEDIEGRNEDVFIYPDGIVVHPQVFRARLWDHRLFEFQVRQTATGAEIAIPVEELVDTAVLAASLRQDLERAGLRDATVRIAIVASLERGRTGKLSQFVPITNRG